MRFPDADRSKSTPKAGGFTVAAAAVPASLSSLVNLYQTVDRTTLPTRGTVSTADQDWAKLQDPSVPMPSAPVYAARLNGLLRSLAAAEGAVADSVKARRELIRELEKIMGDASQALADDEAKLTVLAKRKTDTEEKRREVEHAIMRTLPGQESSGDARDGASHSPVPEIERPEVEELTPPPEEAPEAQNNITPQVSPPPEVAVVGSVSGHEQRAASGIEMLSNLASQYQSLPVSTNGANKRRRVEAEEFPDLGGDDGIDADVAEMLRREDKEA